VEVSPWGFFLVLEERLSAPTRHGASFGAVVAALLGEGYTVEL
jgi:hypothetical protein